MKPGQRRAERETSAGGVIFRRDPDGTQADEGITACTWHPLAEAVATISYDNARGVLRRAAEMVRALSGVEGG